VNAAGIQLESGTLRVGDRIHIQGHTTDFYQRVERLEVRHQLTEWAGPGTQVGLQVDERVREHDVVYKITS
jgi:translation elongation factor EF-1alpha